MNEKHKLIIGGTIAVLAIVLFAFQFGGNSSDSSQTDNQRAERKQSTREKHDNTRIVRKTGKEKRNIKIERKKNERPEQKRTERKKSRGKKVKKKKKQEIHPFS